MSEKTIALRDFTFRYKDKTYSASVPGDVLNDLLVNRLIEPFDAGDDFEKVLWVQEADWEYHCTFELNESDLALKEIRLSFLGIDTFSEISLNGKALGKTDNMFLRYDYGVGDCVKAGKNVLTVRLLSPMKALRAHKNEKYICVFNPDRLFLRKAQCHFGWDWAPELAGYGIYEPVTLTLTDGFTVEDLRINAATDGNVTVFADLSYNVRTTHKEFFGLDTLTLTITDQDGGVAVQKECSVTGQKNIVNARVPSPRLWWPNGYGEPHLYTLSLALKRNGAEICRRVERFGIRAVKIDESPVEGENRLNFRININGRNVYCKGSNWIPLDFMTGCIPESRYERMLGQVRDCNMNMLRVWGGGFYEKECFYRLCDEHGIMLMQEFMIACSDVPEDEPGFTRQLIRESEYQVRRLKNHPSVVLWSGGNERETAFNIRSGNSNNFCSDIVFRGTVGKYSGLPYIEHSPFSYTDMDDDEQSGDSHSSCLDKTIKEGQTYRYRDFIRLRVPAFVSECAALGPARMRSMKRFLKPENLWPLGKVWEKRLRDNPGDSNGLNFTYWIERMSDQLFGKASGIEDFVKKGMVAQYEILYDEILFLRANNRYNGGFLNWMMGDIWGTGTWSVVDYLQEEKGGYYGMKKAFEPFAAGFIRDVDNALKLAVINDTDKTFCGKVVFGAKMLDGSVLAESEREITVPVGKSVKIAVGENCGDYLFAAAGDSTVTYFPSYWKDKKFTSDYTYTADRDKDGIRVTIRADSYLRKVFLTLPANAKARYSDNLFDMQKGESKTVFVTCEGVKPETLKIQTFTDVWDE